MKNAMRRGGMAAAAMLAIFAGGCGDPSQQQRIPLHGTVRVDGALVAEGAITLLPVDGHAGPAASTVIRGGRFAFGETSGPSTGPHRVVVAVDALGTADADAVEEPADQPPDAAAIKRSPGPAGSKGTSARPNASNLSAGNRGQGQWETTYTVPQQGDFRKDFELHAENR